MEFQILMGNKSKCTLVGRGTIEIQMDSMESTSVTDVLHVSGLGMNLISISKLQYKGYGVYFVGNNLFLKH